MTFSFRFTGLLLPEFLPPCLFLRRGLFQMHLAADRPDVPTGQGGQGLGLLVVTLPEAPEVGPRLPAFARFSRPGVAQDVAALEGRFVGGLLEDQVLGEMRRVVAQVQA